MGSGKRASSSSSSSGSSGSSGAAVVTTQSTARGRPALVDTTQPATVAAARVTPSAGTAGNANTNNSSMTYMQQLAFMKMQSKLENTRKQEKLVRLKGSNAHGVGE